MGYSTVSNKGIELYLPDRYVADTQTGCWVWKLRPESKGYGLKEICVDRDTR